MLLWIAIPLAILTEGALFYAAIKFHNNDDPKPTKDNRRLEITWTIGVAIILVFVSAASYVVLTHPMVSTQPGAMPTGNDLHVHITGQDWFWTFTYPKQHVTTTNTLVLPAHRTVFFTITSKDVDHSV
ncbi:MAG TPA: cytochrome c oxidase subunit II transmembrane domain-containing protein, partial [Methanomicrobiales archaeon]|nr:cytochrome c oxidase subunit II transmembrane domain-containing protein [Methanomicrobiales archaeon]